MSEGEGGFTLVELLVALAIVGMVAALLSASLSAGAGWWRRDRAAAGGGETVAAAQALLRERIARLAPPDAADAALPPSTASRFVFLAPPPDAMRAADLQPETLALATDGAVVLATARATLPLIDGVRSIDIAYYGAAPDDAVPRWRARWQGAEPPRLVRVRVGFQPGDRRRWPDLIVRPAVTAAAGCVVDPQKGVCA